MNDSSHADAFRSLELPVDAQPVQVERAFRRKQALYAEGTLATYGLFEEEERQAMLDRCEAAYQTAASASRDACRPPVAASDEMPVTADPVVSPGHYLRARRQAAGLSLRDVATRTKISPMQLAQMEEERYSLLPAPVYLRGFVVAYARALGLPDGDHLAGNFLARQQEQSSEA